MQNITEKGKEKQKTPYRLIFCSYWLKLVNFYLCLFPSFVS